MVLFIKDGLEIRFLEDRWLGNTLLQEQYPTLYTIVRYKNDTIAKVMEISPPNVTFRGKDLYLGMSYFNVWRASTSRT
jgi:hypothetical protein